MADHNVSIGMSSPDVTEREVAAVVSVLRSGRRSLGPAAEAYRVRAALRASMRR